MGPLNSMTQGEDAAHAVLAEFIEYDPKKAAEVIAHLYGSRDHIPEDDEAAVDALLQSGVREALGSLNTSEREDFARARRRHGRGQPERPSTARHHSVGDGKRLRSLQGRLRGAKPAPGQ
jgi:hypothetical protein